MYNVRDSVTHILFMKIEICRTKLDDKQVNRSFLFLQILNPCNFFAFGPAKTTLI